MEAFGVHEKLDFISLSNNQFIGDISPVWGECRNLSNLQLDRNRISGDIPAELRSLTRLGVLSLDSNELTGEIPNELGNLGELLKLNLSNNHFTGEIPHSIGNFSMLQYLDLANYKLTGDIPEDLKSCEQLLSFNGLSGEIPPELDNLLGLQYMLDLSRNSLSGSIPQNLGKLTKLENLNLSHNNLSGSIPESLSGLTSLHLVDFSYNELSGQIPSGRMFKNASEDGFCWKLSLLILSLIIAGVSIYGRKTKLISEEAKSSQWGDSSESLIWERDGKFTFGDIERATQDFSGEYFIGKGGFGSVYKALLPKGQMVAVKKLSMSDTSDVPFSNRQSFENEIRVLKDVRHRNIVKLHGFCSKRGCMYLVYEYVKRGSLRKVLYELEGKVELDWAARVKIVRGVAHAIAYLHHDCSPPIVHRDISLSNILLETDFEPRLSDFGIARLLNPDSSNWTTLAGSYGYMAPELALTMRDVLDQRLPPPTGPLAEEVMFVVNVALGCTHTTPEGRPSMRFVAQELSAKTQDNHNKLTSFQK
ncbi:hypothetical protein Pint_01680 [Pistacia integerrima]|uniref:Uncharacterized protein n=1 Tax=Pistacia integerrima TaxID=434235 RepID=A0ACC0ZKE7_9ROSI|nr:hypothetical protein Pint_01680 [Pistacia integerrima]